MGVRQIFRKNLKHYRKQKGLSQEKLSELIGYGETYITEIESRHKFPKPETIDIIAEKLEIEPYKFFMPLELENESPLYADEDKKQEEFALKIKFLQNQINSLFDESTKIWENAE